MAIVNNLESHKQTHKQFRAWKITATSKGYTLKNQYIDNSDNNNYRKLYISVHWLVLRKIPFETYIPWKPLKNLLMHYLSQWTI